MIVRTKPMRVRSFSCFKSAKLAAEFVSKRVRDVIDVRYAHSRIIVNHFER